MTSQYTWTAKAIHWLTALAVLSLFGLGWYMTSLELSPLMLKLYSWHKWIGLCVLVLTVVRLVWRLTHPAPPLPDSMSPAMKMGAHLGHFGIYALLIVLPLLGWLHSSAAGFPVVWFGILPLPNLVGADKATSDLFSLLHWIGGWTLVVLLIGHIGAALWHHIVKKDDVLERMLPGLAGAGLLAVLVTTIAAPASAGPSDVWQLDAENSEITFVAKQMNVPVNGKFTGYSAEIVFDPAAPEEASLRLEFKTDSLTTGNPQADQALPTADWFAAADHPIAVYEAKGFKANGDQSYEITGRLTLKGIAMPVAVKAAISTEPDPADEAQIVASASGEALISRTAFKIGQGQWANTATIADEVVVAFRLTARRAK